MFKIDEEVLVAEQRIRQFIRETPLEYSRVLSKNLRAHVYLKCENLQYTGSFKIRGALNKLLSLTQQQRAQGVVTASTGNHGAAVAFGLNQLQANGIVFVPENASTIKVENIRSYDVPVEFYATDMMFTELHAQQYAQKHSMVYISPYNDSEVIAGQGTIALELVKQLSSIDAIFIPVGGGGLISGIAGYIKKISPQTKIIGCLPENSPVMAASVKAGHIVEMESLPTFSDATAGGIEPGAITFAICQKYVDDFILVSEVEIAEAMQTIMKTQHLLVEGASGVAMAALIKNAQQYQNQNTVVILSGANVSLTTLKEVL